MSYYANMARLLQSRVKLRANEIAKVECWKRSYHAMGRMKDFRATKEELVNLRANQVLDKALLKLVQGIAIDQQRDIEYLEAAGIIPHKGA